MRYEMRILESGWSVWDIEANAPAIVNGRWQTGLALDSAELLANCLNRQNEASKKSRGAYSGAV